MNSGQDKELQTKGVLAVIELLSMYVGGSQAKKDIAGSVELSVRTLDHIIKGDRVAGNKAVRELAKFCGVAPYDIKRIGQEIGEEVTLERIKDIAPRFSPPSITQHASTIKIGNDNQFRDVRQQERQNEKKYQSPIHKAAAEMLENADDATALEVLNILAKKKG